MRAGTDYQIESGLDVATRWFGIVATGVAALVILSAFGCATPYSTARVSLASIAVADTATYLGVQAVDRPYQEQLVAEVRKGCASLAPSACAANIEARLTPYRHERDTLMDLLHTVESACATASRAVDEAEAHKLDPAGLLGPVLDLWTQAGKLAGDFGVKVPSVGSIGSIGGH